MGSPDMDWLEAERQVNGATAAESSDVQSLDHAGADAVFQKTNA